MITQELISYIKTQLLNGISLDSIKQTLLNQNWSDLDIQAAFGQLQLSSVLVLPSNTPIKKPIPWQIKVGVIVPVIMFIFIFSVFLIQARANKLKFASTDLMLSNPTLDKVQSSLQTLYPEAKVHLVWSSGVGPETNKNKSTLLVLIENKDILNSIQRKGAAVQICTIYVDSNQNLDELLISSLPPKMFGFIPVGSPDPKQSAEGRSCPDWLDKPPKNN